jgi:hypothetical protein
VNISTFTMPEKMATLQNALQESLRASDTSAERGFAIVDVMPVTSERI